jgi:hypothetical protein
VSNCAELDRLSKEWQEAVDKFASAVARLPQTIGDKTFNEQYYTSRLAGVDVERASQALELHRSTHQCESYTATGMAVKVR